MRRAAVRLGRLYPEVVRCAYYESEMCRSCTLIETPYSAQLDAKERACRELLAERVASSAWLPPVASLEAGFRNKAKMVVTGSAAAPRLGILDPRRGGVDLRRCPLYSARMHALLPVLADFVGTAGLTPYDIEERRGELKHVLVTESPDGEFLVRWVLRSTEAVPRISKHLPALLHAHPEIAVMSVNLQSEHKAVLEGEAEEVLTARTTLPMRVNGLVLELPARSFFQTNTAVAAALYRQAVEWADEIAPSSVLDLYCGVGGFALHLAGPGRRVVGVETSAEAVAGAVRAGSAAGVEVEFVAGDATERAIDADLVVVNPPRRGLGHDLSTRLELSEARRIIYSSCNATTLARDLRQMPSWTARRARVLDMFPHTQHYEVIVLLERR